MRERFERGLVAPVPPSGEEGAIEKDFLNMNPSETVKFVSALQEKGELEGFLTKAAKENGAVLAHLSYWQKWLGKENSRMVDRIVAEKREIYGDSESLPLEMEKRFSENELRLIFEHTGAIQLTFGCSKGCPFCGFDAVPGAREHIPYAQLANLFQKYGESLGKSKPLLYWASEPSDYESKLGLEDKTYEDVHQLAVEYSGYNPHVTSREIRDSKWLQFVGGEKVKNGRVSVFGADSKLVEQVLKDGGESLDVVGKDIEHVKGVGMSYKDVEREDPEGYYAGIGCINGVLITPRGVYSVVQLPISDKSPQGQIVVPLQGIEKREIKTGDDLHEVLRGAVITSNLSWVVNRYDRESNTIYSGKILDNLLINTADKRYRVWFDRNGIVTKTEDYYDKEAALEREWEENIIWISEHGDLPYALRRPVKSIKEDDLPAERQEGRNAVIEQRIMRLRKQVRRFRFDDFEITRKGEVLYGEGYLPSGDAAIQDGVLVQFEYNLTYQDFDKARIRSF